MKNKWIVGALMIAGLFCYGLAFAASADTMESAQTTDTLESTKATTEDMGGESSLDTMASDESTAPADELYTPADASAKAGTATSTDETKKI